MRRFLAVIVAVLLMMAVAPTVAMADTGSDWFNPGGQFWCTWHGDDLICEHEETKDVWQCKYSESLGWTCKRVEQDPYTPAEATTELEKELEGTIPPSYHDPSPCTTA